jgi:DNA-binding transcriptional ArsR family regulator
MIENAGLVKRERRGQLVLYRFVRDSLTGYAFELCPVGRPLECEWTAA